MNGISPGTMLLATILILYPLYLKYLKVEMKDWAKPRTAFTAVFYGLFCWLIMNGLEIPAPLNTIVSTLFGYWFGSRKQNGKEIQQ